MDTKPIPAFYCCYLLRSTVQRAFTYIGSSPNMLRRLRQHNGEAKGGAKRTSRKTLKPWEVTCIVHGFPSKIAALQFEWAWQNTHKSRHAKDDEANQVMMGDLDWRVSPRSGKVRKKKPTTRARSLTDRVTNLHILLRARSFERWPLTVRFFNTDVFRVWKAIDGKMDSDVPASIKLALDEHAVDHYDKTASPSKGSTMARLPLNGVENLDFGYSKLKPHIEKSLRLLGEDGHSCSVCRSKLRKEDNLLLTCSHEGCNAISHMGCLSKQFLTDSRSGNDALVPTQGLCPSCERPNSWHILVQELTLRARGQKEVAQLFKKPRGKKADQEATEEQLDKQDEKEDDDDFVDFEEFEAEAIKKAEKGELPEDTFHLSPSKVKGRKKKETATAAKATKATKTSKKATKPVKVAEEPKSDPTRWSDVTLLD